MNTPFQLANLAVFLSTSIPDEALGTRRGIIANDLLVVLVREILRGGGTVVFGGHPTVTKVVFEVAAAEQVSKDRVQLHQLRRFRAGGVSEMWRSREVGSVTELGPDGEPKSPGIGRELASMRDAMARSADAAILVGGRLNSLTTPPGLRDEYQRFRGIHPLGPVFLVGTLGGYVAGHLIPDARTGALLPHDGLTDSERQTIYSTSYGLGVVELVASVVLTGLTRFRRGRAVGGATT